MTETTKKELKEGFNKVTVVGTLVEKNFEDTFFTNQQGERVDQIKGTISIRTGENEVHQVKLESNKLNKEGKENGLAKGYNTVRTEFVSVADVAEGTNKLAKLNGVKDDSGEGLVYSYDEAVKVLNKQSFDTKFVANPTDKIDVLEKDGLFTYKVQYVKNDENNQPLYRITIEASQVSVDGSLITNEYYGQDGQLKQYQQIKGRFVNRLRETDDKTPKAQFEIDIFVDKVRPEMKDGEETGRAIVEAWVPTYSLIFPYKFVVVEEGSDFFLNSLERGQTLKVYGNNLNVRKETIKLVEAAFGSPIEEKTVTYVSESLINNAKVPYEEDSANSFKPELVKERLTKREIRLEQQKTKKQGGASKSDNRPNAFGTPSNTAPKKEDPKVDISKYF
ncbi:hypothetical protein [Bacillus sp. FJAT-22090]|uniref:hypothetical protein n=1 Tax=Bacillus sp. FJAT-22090 TaxID=1581038 RepID=UPI00119D1BE9|nr:hypothetical protein [Bacillus sp. FJAT-22090]